MPPEFKHRSQAAKRARFRLKSPEHSPRANPTVRHMAISQRFVRSFLSNAPRALKEKIELIGVVGSTARGRATSSADLDLVLVYSGRLSPGERAYIAGKAENIERRYGIRVDLESLHSWSLDELRWSAEPRITLFRKQR